MAIRWLACAQRKDDAGSLLRRTVWKYFVPVAVATAITIFLQTIPMCGPTHSDAGELAASLAESWFHGPLASYYLSDEP